LWVKNEKPTSLLPFEQIKKMLLQQL